jgi:protoheme ferro-lyase
MRPEVEQEYAHIGETHAAADHDRDLVHELSKRLDAVWRYDQYLANAEWREDLQELWRDLREQDQRVINRLKGLIAREIENHCF